MQVRKLPGLTMKRRVLAALLWTAVTLAASREAQADVVVRIGGNGSALGAMKLLAKAYRKTHPGVTVTVVPNLGSSGGIAALRKGALDLAISARTLTPEEKVSGVQTAEYARTPFTFATHSKVTKTGLSTDELIGIFQQDAPTWPDGSRIRLILRPLADADTALVEQISPALKPALQKTHARPGMAIAITDQDSLDAIARMPGSLGGVTLTEVITEERAVRLLSFNGVQPTLKNLANGSYPLVKKFYLASTGKTPDQARQFAAFVRSAQARDLLIRSGNLTPEER